MTGESTTIRVSLAQRQRLRQLATERSSTMADTLDDALEALRRDLFYRSMATAETELRSDPEAWANYLAERDAWLGADLA
jgi:predicted DNA-binding protein